MRNTVSNPSLTLNDDIKEKQKGSSHLRFKLGLRRQAVVVVCMACVVVASSARAEGMRELMANGGYRPFIQYQDLPNPIGFGLIAGHASVKVYVNSGESIFLGSSAQGKGAGTINVTAPDGTTAFTSGASTTIGLIQDSTQETAGPLPNAGGYNPFIVSSVAQTGIYTIVFVSPKSTDNSSPPPTTVAAGFTAASQPSTSRWIYSFDVTVRTSGGITQLGRAFANFFDMNLGGNGAERFNSNAIVLTKDGYQYQVNMNGLDPFGFYFYSNNRGNIANGADPVNHPLNSTLYHSLALQGGNPGVFPGSYTAAAPFFGTIHPPDTADTATDITNKCFFNTPDPALPSTAAESTGAGASFTDWLLSPPLATPPPTVFKFTGSESTSGQAGVGLGGVFTFNSVVAGSYTIIIDTVQDGTFATFPDRVLRGIAVVGLNSIAWDGKDQNGVAVPASNTAYGAQVTVSTGEVHFPVLDAENNPNGIIITRLNGAAGPNVHTVFYDDSNIPASAIRVGPPVPVSQIYGVDSTPGVHKWGNGTGSGFGNICSIDTWANYPSAPVLLAGAIAIRQAELSIIKTGPATVRSGNTITYTVMVSNVSGGGNVSDLVGVSINDALVAGIIGVTWTATATGGATGFTTPGAGNALSDTVNMPNGSTITYTVIGTVGNFPTGTVSNTAWVLRPLDVFETDDPTRTSAGNNTVSVSTNVQPLTVNDSYSTSVNTTLTVPVATGILVNDFPDGGTIMTHTLPAKGTLTSFPNDGSFIYAPNAGFSGTDTFTYTVANASGNSTATVTITVNPKAVNDAYAATAGTALVVPAGSGVLANDLGSGVLENSVVTGPANGVLGAFNANGSFTYTPNAGFSGTDTFTYNDKDSSGDTSNTATVTITVNPKAVNDAYAATAGTALVVPAASGVLTNDLGSGLLENSVVTGPANGVLGAFNANGSFTYTPNAGFSGTDTFTYNDKDSSGDAGNTATVTITVSNPAPVANNDAYPVTFNTALTVTAANGVLKNDSDADGETISVVTPGTFTSAKGTFVLAGDGSFTYTPTATATGTDTFTYTVKDPSATGNTANVVFAISNPAPVATDDAYAVTFNTPLTVTAANGVLKNDTDADGEVLSILTPGSTTSGKGTFALAADGSFTYTPTAIATGTDTFTYQVKDPSGNGNTANVVFTISNPAPTATDDAFAVTFNTPLVVAAPGVLSNDSDADGETISVAVPGTSATTKGSVTINSDGSFTYTPNSGGTGTDSFTYTVKDPTATGNTATVTLTISNPAPVATDDVYSVTFNTPLTVAAPGVLGNDSDPDGETLSVVSPGTIVTMKGSVTINGDGSFTYTPNSGATGTDSFTYAVKDPTATGNTATVTLTISNPAPVATDDTYAVTFNTPLTVAAPGVLGNDSDPDVETLSVVSPGTVATTKGSVTINSDGSFNYTPNSGATGTDTFTYTVKDPTATGNTATVTFNISNPAPVATDDAYAVTFNTPLIVAAPGVLSNDSDADGEAISVAVPGTSATAKGSVTINSDGSFTYTPNSGATGTDTFTYTVTDPTASGNTATVTLNISNPAPVATDDVYAVTFNTPLAVAPPGVLSNDSDPDGEAISVAAPGTSLTTKGSVTLNSDGSFTYTPNSGATGTDTFTYTVTDPTAAGNTATVTLTIANPAPVATDDAYGVLFNTPLTIAATAGVLSNDSDPDGEAISVAAPGVIATSKGSVALNSDGSFVYTPNAGATGTDTFTYAVKDPTTTGNTATVTLTISVNPNPQAINDAYAVVFNTPLTVNAASGVLANDSDPDGETISVTVPGVIATVKGSVTLNSDGSFVYTPNAGATGTDTFTYAVKDPTATGNTATVTLTIANPAPIANDDTYAVTFNTPLVVNAAAGVLANDRDPDGEALSVAATGTFATSKGSVTLNANGSFTYTPNTGATGADTFTYAVKDPSATGNTATVTLTISAPLADMAVTVSVNNVNVTVGQTVIFTITATNNGPDDATNVAILDLLPAGETFVSSTVTQGLYNSGTGVWNIPSAPVGSVSTFTLTAIWAAPGAKTDTATVTAADQTDPVLPNNSASVTVAGSASADLGITKTVDNASPVAGQNVTYMITVSNAGPSNATGVQVTDLLPAGLQFVSASPSQGAYAADTGLWTVGSISNGATATLSITASVAVTSTIANIAQITGSNQPDPNSSNDIASASLTPVVPTIAISKTVDNPTPLPGDTVNFTITVVNNGQFDIPALVVQDSLPALLVFVSATPSQGAYDTATGLWTVGALPSGVKVTLVMAATVTGDGSITNTATIITPSMVKLSALNGGALPPGVNFISTATTVTASGMAPSCFAASFNLVKSNRDKLLFTSKVVLPAGFKLAGQPVSFSLAGFNYSCVLNSKGQSRNGTKLVQLRQDRANGWVVMLRVTNDNLKQIRGVLNENAVNAPLTNMLLRVELAGKSYVSRGTHYYNARQNRTATLR